VLANLKQHSKIQPDVSKYLKALARNGGMFYNVPRGSCFPIIIRGSRTGGSGPGCVLRFSVVWCETSWYRLKVYYSVCLFDDQELILY